MPEKKMVLLDWDGTIVNSMPIWYASVKEVFESQGLPTPSAIEYLKELESQKSFMDVYRHFGLVLSEEGVEKIYRQGYEKRLDETKLSSGAEETIRKLQQRQIILGIVTAQLTALFEPIFFKFKLSRYFKYVVVETLRKNAAISHLCAKERMDPGYCYYVGDAPFDIVNAQKAGVRSVAYLTDFMPKELLLSKNPDFVISDLRELPRIIQ